MHLVEDLAGRREWLDENRLLIADVRRDEMQIFKRQRQVLGESAVVRNDAQDGATRAMRLQAAAAELADGLVAISRAGHVNLAGNALVEPFPFRRSRNAVNGKHFTNKFVANDASKIVIAAQNFHIGVADAGHANANERPAGT